LTGVASEAYQVLHRNLIDGSKRALITEVSLLQPLPDPKNSTYAVVKQKIFSDPTGISIYANSFLHQSYLDKIMQLVESGIIENIMSYLKPRNLPKDDERVALSIDHLLIWFQLWAGLLLVAVLFFLLEILFVKTAKVWMKKNTENTPKVVE
jgi:hypothetical protein